MIEIESVCDTVEEIVNDIDLKAPDDELAHINNQQILHSYSTPPINTLRSPDKCRSGSASPSPPHIEEDPTPPITPVLPMTPPTRRNSSSGDPSSVKTPLLTEEDEDL